MRLSRRMMKNIPIISPHGESGGFLMDNGSIPTHVLNSSSTFNDRCVEYLNKNRLWICEQLLGEDRHANVSLDEIERVSPFDWTPELVRIAFKRSFFPNMEDIVTGNNSSISDEIGNNIESVESMGKLDSNIIRFYSSKKVGQYHTYSPEYMMSIQLRDPKVKFIVFATTVACGAHQEEINEILIYKPDLEKLVSYVQDIERKLNRIIVNVYGQKVYNIKPIGWDDLVLEKSVKFLIKDDLESFLKKKDWFSSHGLPYRRGYLLYGPPGNGKSSVIRAMLTQSRIPAFTIKRLHDEEAMYYFEDMFEEASRSGGAFIILEDIDRAFSTKGVDSKESESSRIPFSVLLNCLDGISEADGVIVVATANNPSLLDPAILQRPGRFDRLVKFGNPTADLRKEFFTKKAIGASTDYLTEHILEEIAKKTDDMSFAQLREVYILGAQLSDSKERPLCLDDILESCSIVSDYMKKASKSESLGFKK